MHAYTVYGLSIVSEVALPELVRESREADRPRAGEPDVRIRIDPVDFSGLSPADESVIAWAGPDDVCVRYRGVAAYRVTGGRSIQVHLVDGADEGFVRLFLLGPALAILLHQRKWLVLHASGIRIHGHAAVFVGNKGQGKSTLAAALLAHGYPLIADDLVPVDFSDPDHPVVHPGFPQLKIAPATAESLGHESAALALLHHSLPKRGLRAGSDFARSTTPLGRIFVLGKGENDGCLPLSPQKRFVELVRHSYLAPLLQSTGEAAAHFAQVAALASRVPVMELRRRWDLAGMPRVVAMVEAEMARAAAVSNPAEAV